MPRSASGQVITVTQVPGGKGRVVPGRRSPWDTQACAGPWAGKQDLRQERFGATRQRAEKGADLGCRRGWCTALPGEPPYALSLPQPRPEPGSSGTCGWDAAQESRSRSPGTAAHMRREELGADRCLCVQIVKELLSHGADPNLPLTRGLGSALCVACDPTCEPQRSTDSKLALVRVRPGGGCAGQRALACRVWVGLLEPWVWPSLLAGRVSSVLAL